MMVADPSLVPDDFGLGFIDIRDPRDEAYQVGPLLAAALAEVPRAAPARRWRYWWPGGWWGDQGALPWCVAYSGLHALEDGPITFPDRRPGAGPVMDPAHLYHTAQRNDEWWGEGYDGTSVRAGAKVLQDAGLISGYRWAFTMEDLVATVLEVGPVIMGTWWYTGMFWPDAEGIIRVSGRRAGGHAYKVDGLNLETGLARVKNSWSRRWGVRGFAYLPLEDLERLLLEDGEACIYTEVERAA